MNSHIILTIVTAFPSILLYCQVVNASAYPSSIIKRVVVVGGTHGNEYTGVWCIKAIEQQRKHYEKNPLDNPMAQNFPSLDISTLLSNREAFLANKRFIDCDLNREFSKEKLLRNTELYTNEKMEKKDEKTETKRALELDSIFGSKKDVQGNKKTDVIVDLHSTTTNMGMTVIVPEGDALMAQAAAYVMAKFKQDKSLKCCRCLMHSIPNADLRPNLSSVGKHGFTIEVGAVPQGVLRHDGVENTQKALHYFLEFLEKRNVNENKVLDEMEKFYPDGKVPCFLSAKAKRSGEMSGKLTWPCDNENPNFPTIMVHKNIQDNDFQKIRKGDPLFVRWDGSTISYNGSHGVSGYSLFLFSLFHRSYMTHFYPSYRMKSI